MRSSYVTSIVLIFFYALVHFACSLTYSDLEALGIACPKRDKCQGYKNDLPYMQRSCECDSACRTYKDCCIDVRKRPSGQTASPNNIICLNYGENNHTGIYVVSRCSSNWDGSREVSQKCEGPADFSDPVAASPVTSTSEGVTYKNLYCAECNNADMTSLQLFHFKVSCEGLDDLTQEQIMEQMSYNQEKRTWGVNRVNTGNTSGFTECEIFYDVPANLNTTVRFCRANIISTCARDWTRQQVRRYCDEYMAVVYDKVHAYRNPHCARCNHVAISELSCTTDLSGRTRPFSLKALIDIQQSDDTITKCSSGEIYDPYIKRCRALTCAFPGYVIQNGKCVPGG